MVGDRPDLLCAAPGRGRRTHLGSATPAEERRRGGETTQSAEQHADLLAKINQLNILRESNTTLRDENERNVRRTRELEVKLKGTESRLEPLNEQVRNLQAELESRGYATWVTARHWACIFSPSYRAKTMLVLPASMASSIRRIPRRPRFPQPVHRAR